MIRNRRRENPAIAENLEAVISNYKEALRNMYQTVELKDHPGWTGLMAEIDFLLERVREKLSDPLKLSSEARLAALIQQSDLEYFRDLPKTIEEVKIPKTEGDLATAEQQLKERNERSKNRQTTASNSKGF